MAMAPQTATKLLSLLLVENDPADAELTIAELSRAGFHVLADTVDDEAQFRQRLASKTYDLVISDYRLSQWTGMDAHKVLSQIAPDVPFILVTGTLGEDRAVECIKQGITDYILKDQLVRLPLAAQRALEESTERKVRIASVRAMRESEERYRKLVEISPDAIFVHQDKRIVYVNPACSRLLGADSPEQLIGRLQLDLVHPSYHQIVKERINDCLGSEIPTPPLLQSWIRLDGKPVEVEAAGSAFNWNGRPAILVAGRDVTERKRAETALRESEEKFRSLLDSTAEAIYGLGIDGKCTFCNSACLRILGYTSPEMLLGRNMHEVIHHSLPDGTPYPIEDCPIFNAFVSGIPGHVDADVLWRADGSSFPAEYWSYPIHKDGKCLGSVVAFLDITERKQAEHALRRSEERYRLLFEMNPQPMWVYHLATLNFLAVNQAAVDHYGYSRDEFMNMTIRDIRPAEDIPDLERSVFDASVPLDKAGVWRHRTKYGRLIHVEIVESQIEFEGKAARLVLAYDVTERVQGEKKLRLQAAALESAANAIIITDATGNIQWVNPAFERLTKYSSNEIMGHNPRLLKSGQHDSHFYRSMWNAILSGCTWQGELVNRRKDGSLYTEHQTVTPVRDEKGVITNFVGIKVDITEQKRAEEALRRSESEFRSIIEGAPYGIYRVGDDGVIQMANPALAAMLGYESPAQLVGRNTATDVYLSPQARQESASRWVGKAVVEPYEVSWKKKDGKPIQVRLAGRSLPATADGLPVYEVFVADITEQRSLEEQFRQAQKMEAVGRLAGGIAHDFNNLLMIISSYAELLIQVGGRDATVDRYSHQIREAASRAAGVTQQLLAFSRKQVLSPSVIDLNTVITDMGRMLPRLLGEDVAIVQALGQGLGRVKVDRGQTEQIIMNLAVNARDAMPKGGKLVIETYNVDVDGTHARQHPTMIAGSYVVLTVSDSGMGIKKSVLPHIFEPFFTTKDAGKGTGLGLATVYGIVKQSGGFVWVYSEEGVGTCFKIYLPRVDEELAKTVTVPGQSEIPGGHETVMIVEDEAGLRAAASEFLESKGYHVIEAANAAEALQQCTGSARRIDLLLTDVVMPGTGGIELAKSVADLLPDIKVIYMSGYSDRAIDVAQFRSGGILLQKPFGLDTLATKVRAVLDNHGEAGGTDS